MPDSRADQLISRQQALASDRSTIESHWQEIAELVKPMRADFTTTRKPGEKRGQKVFDSTATTAANSLAAGLWGMITNAANEWFAIEPQIEELKQDRDTAVWCDMVTRAMRAAFADNGHRFYARVFTYYADFASFGTGVMYTDEAPATGLWFSHRHLAECYIAEDDREAVDTVIRKFRWSARQAAQRWGEQRLGKEVTKALEKEPDRQFWFLHGVAPAEEMDVARKDARGMPFGSRYVSLEDRHVIAEGGYHEFPFQVARWSTDSGYVYGDSPGMAALADIKMLNAMSKTTIVAAQKQVDPPLLAFDELTMRGVRTAPGSIIYGGVDQQGRQMIQPLVTNARVELGLEMQEQRREAIREAFHWSLMLMVVGDRATATEVLAKQEEKLRMLGPHLGRVQSEFLDPLIDRVFGLLWRAGAFPPPPPVLRQYPGLKVNYVSPLARAQRASEGAAIVRALEAMGPLAAVRPEVLDNLDGDEAVRAIAAAFGLSPKMLRDPRVVAQLRQQRQQQQAMAAMVEAAGPVSGALKNLSQAGMAA